MQNLKYYLLFTAIHHKINETNHFRNWLVFLIPASQENQGFFAFLLCIFISNKLTEVLGFESHVRYNVLDFEYFVSFGI